MKTKIFKSMWGMTEGETWDDKLRLIKEAGYDGVEYDPPSDMSGDAWQNLCSKHGLDFIASIYPFTTEEFAEQLKRVADYGPILANSHTGRDKFSFDEGCRHFEAVLKSEAKVGLPVAHETHRHRILFTPWTTAAYLEKFPELKLNADFSHWVLVCESRLADVDEMVDLACRRTLHVHGRVGYEESPQLSDPRAPEYAVYVELFEGWWDRIRKAKQDSGAEMMTFTPEYGPPGYMPTQPYTQQPLVDLWEICLWSANRLRERWGL